MIDCHVHLWDLAEGHPWIKPDSPHFRRFGAADLAASGAGLDLAGAVLVEASRGDAGETSALRDLRRRHPELILGYVANVHVHADAGPDGLRALIAESAPNGMRLGGADWLSTPKAARDLVPVLAEHGVVLELNLIHGALRAAAEVSDRHPDLTVVVDHLGNPARPAAGDPAAWRADVTAAARRPGVVMKLSGLLTQQRGVPAEQAADLVRHAVDRFGPDRCVVGSDWPVCLSAGSRAESLDLVLRGLDGLTASEQERVRRGTARRVYRLNPAEAGETAYDR